MSRAKPLEERLAALDEQKRKLEAQRKDLLARSKEQERKERTKRLIQVGGIMHIIGIETVEQAEQLRIACENDEKLLKQIYKAAGVSWPPPEKMEKGTTSENNE